VQESGYGSSELSSGRKDSTTNQRCMHRSVVAIHRRWHALAILPPSLKKHNYSNESRYYVYPNSLLGRTEGVLQDEALICSDVGGRIHTKSLKKKNWSRSHASDCGRRGASAGGQALSRALRPLAPSSTLDLLLCHRNDVSRSSAIDRALFSSLPKCFRNTVALSSVYDNYCLIID